MEQKTAEFIVKAYAVLGWICAIAFLLLGLAFMFGGSLLGFVMNGDMARMMDLPSEFTGQMMGSLVLIIGVVLIGLAVLYFFIARGLWRKDAWARIAAIVLGVLELFSFPLGTLIGGFAIWFFGFSNEGRALFGVGTPVSTASTPAAKSARTKTPVTRKVTKSSRTAKKR